MPDLNLTIRPERASEAAEIHQLTQAAFETARRSSGTEALIVDALRDAGDLSLSLVAENEGEIVGHVAFSPVTLSGVSTDEEWWGLGPISAKPDLQRQGIGSALIKESLGQLRNQSLAGCVLVGDPNYYQRFGFLPSSGVTYGEVPTKNVMQLPFDGVPRKGAIAYCDAFERAARSDG